MDRGKVNPDRKFRNCAGIPWLVKRFTSSACESGGAAISDTTVGVNIFLFNPIAKLTRFFSAPPNLNSVVTNVMGTGRLIFVVVGTSKRFCSIR